MRPCSRGLTVGFVVISLAQFAIAQEAAKPEATKPSVTSVPAVSVAIQDALQSRQFEQAVTAIDAELAKPDVQHADYLLYLKGRALTELKRYDEAVAAFAQIEQQHADGPWASRAKFGRADVFVRSRNYQAAGEVYRAEAERLLSRERKDELAAIYLEFADLYYEGVPSKDPAQEKKPDYQQALTYYQEAVKLGPTLKLQQKMEFRIARCQQELGQHGEAIGAYQRFLEQYAADNTPGGKRAPVDMVAEAQFQLGLAQLNAGQHAEARKTWQDLISGPHFLPVAELLKSARKGPFIRLADDDPGRVVNQQPDTAVEAPSDAVGRFQALASYRLAHTYGVPSPGTDGDLELGVAAAEKFIAEYPDHELAPQAELEIAQSYMNRQRQPQAVERLQGLIANPKYAQSKVVPEARFLLGSAFAQQKKYAEAIAAWRDFLDKHPTDPKWADVQRTIVDTEYAMAEEQFAQKNYDQSRQLWETFLNKYPLDPRAAQVLFNFGRMKFTAAAEKHVERIKAAVDQGQSAQSVELNDECKQLFEEAIADWKRLVSKYPGTGEASQAAYMIGVTLEDRLARLKDALEAYRQVTGDQQAKANERIAGLTTPQLEVATERKFRSDEKPRIKVTTRNIEAVSVKAYRIDMNDYFRKMHLASGVETLDIALIDPDQQLEHKVGGYEEYRRIEQDVEIPIEGAGVTAVTVSSDKLEATTMVVVSDLDVIVKSSRNELFLFAQNMRTGQPVEGASILISDGSEIFAEELTGKDGVLQKSYEQLKSVEDLRIFAIHEGNAASTVNNLNGLDFAVGLTPRGYLYTDRPAYRAGQLVNIKAIVRWVDQDRFTFKAGEKYKLDVYDARSRLIHTQEVALNPFGAISDNLILPETAPQGDYRVHLHQPAGNQSYETNFSVLEYRLEPVQLTIDLPRKVYYRGEKVEGTVTLKYYYGTPLAGREVQYAFADQGWQTATTDEKGQVKVSFETQKYSESQPLTLAVQHNERGLSTAQTVYLATRGFDVAVSTLREVYIDGETFDATLKVSDAAGDPIATALNVEVFEETFVRGVRGERLVSTHEVKTDAKTGDARQTLRLDDGGRYIVRATGTDQFDNPVSGQSRVYISGEKDAVRLRILADQHHYNVGDEAKVQLHWREAPALALVTYEGASVLGYRLVQLQTGANALAIPLASQLAPNFNLSVAVMEHSRFHAASSAFRVSQRLNVVLKPTKTELKPGEELTIEIEVTDPQGKPVAAELSLGLVQSNLLNLFGDVQGVIDAFFGAGERTPSVRQATSCTFAYMPTTREISRFLLAEEERRAVLENEVKARARFEALRELAASADGVAIASGLERYSVDNFVDVETGRQLAEADAFNVAAGDDFGWAKWSFAGAAAAGDEVAPSGTEVWEALTAKRRKWRPVDPGQMSGAIASGGAMGAGFGAGGSSPAMYAPTEGGPGQGRAERFRDSRHSVELGGVWVDADSGNGQQAMQEYGTTLSLIIEQTQRVHVRTDGRGDFDGEVPVKQLFTNGGQFHDFVQNADVNLNGLTDYGVFLNLNGRDEDDLKQLTEQGLRLLPGMADAETAFWNPIIVTDADGKATVTIRLPERSTAWKLRSKGINGESLAGQAEVDLITKKDLFGELKLPLAFTDGDKAEVQVEIHNSLAGARPIAVTLKATIGEKTTEVNRTVDVTGPGISELSFPIEAGGAESVAFQLSVVDKSVPVAQSVRDTVTRTVPIRPYGMPVYATASGTASQSTIAFVNFDQNLAAENPVLEIAVGPNVNRALLDAVLGGGFFPLERCALPVSSIERSVSDVLGGVALLQMTGASRDAGTPEAMALAGKISSGVAQLVSSQRDDGAWSWSGRPNSGEPDRYLSSRVVWALSAAREAGFAVEANTFNSAVQYLRTAFTQSSPTDREGRAILLHGLATAGAADFAAANQLHRERNNLSSSGLLHVALTLAELDRKEMAADLVQLVAGKEQFTANPSGDGSQQRSLKNGNMPWMQDDTELYALYLLALEAIEPASPKAGELANHLLKSRVGSRWPVEKANGPAIAALAQWFAKTQHTAEKYTLTVYVNDREVEKLTVEPATDASRRISVPREALVAGKAQRINFDLEGRGTFTYSAVLTGFVPTAKLQSTTNDWTVTRRYEPAQRMLDGQPIPRGFGVLTGNFTPFTNPLTQLPVGERGEVTLSPRRRNIRNTPDEQFDYLIVTEPVPAGCTVLADSISGDFERYEQEAGAITFYIGSKRAPGDIRYTLVGYVPGGYQATPTVVRSFYSPQRMAVATPASLSVLARGEKSADEYKLTPDELYNFGQRLLAKGDHAGAHGHLANLFANWRLGDQPYKETVRMLFTTSLVADSHGEIVKFFEIIKEKFPDIEVSFEDILKVANAFREIGEYERSYLVYRSTVQASFERESQVAGFLDGRGEFLRSVQVMEDLLRDYPAESYIAAATYALAQEVYRKAPAAKDDAKLKEAGVTRVDLIGGVIGMLDHFLTTWPQDPAADQASFALANALLDLEQYDGAIARCEQYGERYPQSRLVDSYWYIIGYSQFALGHHEQALEMCRKVAEAKFPVPETGGQRDADNKWEAVYIMGQVYHSLGQPGEALSEYEQVKDRFADASEAIRYFTQKEIKLDEVTTIKPADAKQLTLKFRNVPEASIKVYRIDLMKFGLMQRNLDRITAINLAGIRPYHEETVQLGDGKDYRDREQAVTLPLKDEGAYLVVCRGENLYASGLVLVSPLALEVQEDATSGRVRVTVKDVTTEKYAGEVQVKVIGSANSEFTSGDTDLRGLFIADDIQGTSTVIAAVDQNRYAFYRGQTPLQGGPQDEAKAEQEAMPAPSDAPPGKDAILRGNLMQFNEGFQNQNADAYKNLLNNDRQALPASQAY